MVLGVFWGFDFLFFCGLYGFFGGLVCFLVLSFYFPVSTLSVLLLNRFYFLLIKKKKFILGFLTKYLNSKLVSYYLDLGFSI